MADESCYFCRSHPAHEIQRAELDGLKLQLNALRAAAKAYLDETGIDIVNRSSSSTTRQEYPEA